MQYYFLLVITAVICERITTTSPEAPYTFLAVNNSGVRIVYVPYRVKSTPRQERKKLRENCLKKRDR